VGAQLVADARVMGLLFTGSTEVARLLQRSLAGRLDRRGHPVPLIAETGGQNAMIVDSSALAEQVVADVIASAFDSAGQRCSALRVLCLQEDIAEHTLVMLRGALAELRLGRPDGLAVDVGPVIDADARETIERHIEGLRERGRRVTRWQPRDGDADEVALQRGPFVAPAVIELDHLGELQREVFGPVLHVLRWRRAELPALLDQIHASGYGLTLGLHTRIDETIAQLSGAARIGNVYVNRNMVGAVVGVQPFGGEGLSGTGPKAGGPLYLYRLLSARPADVLDRALGFVDATTQAPIPPADRHDAETTTRPALRALQAWAVQQGNAGLAATCAEQARRAAALGGSGAMRELAGPTGERNIYRLRPREAVLCLTDNGPGSEADRLAQLAAVLAVGSRAVWPAEAAGLHGRLGALLQGELRLCADWGSADAGFDAVLHSGGSAALRSVCVRLAERPGALVGVTALAPGETDLPLERLLVERSLSINTAAAGGNASLMTLDID
jgi:RHH-type proline utilization regulon transcriptional repressor/proline dehydrogenase/delta 1-pyrroline-5-carboxylate dehydrogenase